MLDNAMLKNVALKMETPVVKRGAAAYLRTFFERGQRRVCKALGADHASVRYRGQRASDAIVRARLRELAVSHRRFRYRCVLMAASGWS